MLKVNHIHPKVPVYYSSVICLISLLTITTIIIEFIYNVFIQQYIVKIQELLINNIQIIKTIYKYYKTTINKISINKSILINIINVFVDKSIQIGIISTFLLTIKDNFISFYYEKHMRKTINKYKKISILNSMKINIWNKANNYKVIEDKFNINCYFSFRLDYRKTLIHLSVSFFCTIVIFLACLLPNATTEKSPKLIDILGFCCIVLFAEILLSMLNNVGIFSDLHKIVTQAYLREGNNTLFNPNKISNVMKNKYSVWCLCFIIICTWLYYYNTQPIILTLGILLIYKRGFFSGYLSKLILYHKLLNLMRVPNVKHIKCNIKDFYHQAYTSHFIENMMNNYTKLPKNIRIIRPYYVEYTISELLNYYGFRKLQDKYEALHQVGVLEQLRSMNNDFLDLPLNYSAFSRKLLERIMITGALKSNQYLFVWDFYYHIPSFIMNHIQNKNKNFVILYNTYYHSSAVGENYD